MNDRLLWLFPFASPWACILIWWIWIGIREWRKANPAYALQPAAKHPEEAPLPISVVIPARNESHSIGDCVRCVLDQDLGFVELVLIDDRSTDGTADIARKSARGDQRLVIVEGEPPPSGWLGKPAALVRGFAHTSGQWLVFVDADVRLSPGCLRRAFAYAKEHGLDFLSLAPFEEGHLPVERLIQPWVFGVLDFLVESWAQAASPDGPITLANGQFILVKRTTYEKLGTHAAVSAKVTDDVALAQAARRVGAKTAFVPAPSLVRTRMYQGWREIQAGWTRTLSQAVASGSLLRSIFVAWVVFLGSVVPFCLLPFQQLGGFPVWVLCCAICLVDALIRVRKNQWPVYALAHPLGALGFAYLLLRSAWREYRKQPIVWKDRDILIS